MRTPQFTKPRRITGSNILFRDATRDDAEFILGLRTDPTKARFLSATPNDLQSQIDWLERYSCDPTQLYFIIEGYDQRLGTVRMYDRKGNSFSWGSWIIKDGAPSSCAVESALMVYRFAVALGFKRSHFEVKKDNVSVWKFHQRFGAKRTGETDDQFQFEIDADAIDAAIKRYSPKYLPEGIELW